MDLGGVRFLWPAAIVFVLVVPAFLWFYIRIDRQRSLAGQRHPALYPHATGPAVQRSFARHIPLALFLASMVAIGLALARPQAMTTLFAAKGTVVLAIDVSTSMKADDEPASRLARAQVLAKEFVAEHADELRIGLVAFGANAETGLEPTTGREELFAAIDRLSIRPGTAIGSGIAGALAMIFPEAGIDTSAWAAGGSPARPDVSSVARRGANRTGSGPGAYSDAAIILISDGQSTGGPEPAEAARLAADLGVRIHAIGVGSNEGRPMRLEGWAMRVQLEETPLKEIAALTRGEYFRASSGIEWQRIVNSIRPEPPDRATYAEVTALFAAAAALVAIAAALVSLRWTQRIL